MKILTPLVILILCSIVLFNHYVGIPTAGIGCIDVPPSSVTDIGHRFCWVELRYVNR